MNLTREQAIYSFRQMWNWLADETEKQKRKVKKHEYPLMQEMSITNECFICEYCANEGIKCNNCIIVWPGTKAVCGISSPYILWLFCGDREWEKAARYAREIANLPERVEGKKNDPD